MLVFTFSLFTVVMASLVVVVRQVHIPSAQREGFRLGYRLLSHFTFTCLCILFTFALITFGEPFFNG